jgi:hypothetical protein
MKEPRVCFICDERPARHVAWLVGIGRAALCDDHAATSADRGRPVTPLEAVEGLDAASMIAYGTPRSPQEPRSGPEAPMVAQ